MPAPAVSGSLADAQQAADDYVDTVVIADWAGLWDLLPLTVRTDVSREQLATYGAKCDHLSQTYDVREVVLIGNRAEVRADRDGKPANFDLVWDTDVWRFSPPPAQVEAWQQTRC